MNNKKRPLPYRVEDQACKVNECVQILHYIAQEIEDNSMPDKGSTLDDMEARIHFLCCKIHEDLKEIREELYSIYDEIA